MINTFSSNKLKQAAGILTITILALLIPIILFNNLKLDNNALTRWSWVFANADLKSIYLTVAAAILLSYILSWFSFYEQRPVLFLFSVSFVSAALCWSEPELIVDASRYFTQAKHINTYGVNYFFREWGNSIFAWLELPLIPFLYGLVFKLFGESRFYLQLLTTLFFSGTVILIFQTGRALWNREVGFHAALMLLAFPFLYTQVPLVMVDVPTMFFFMLAVYLFIRVLQDGGNKLIIMAGLSIALAFMTKYTTWIFLSVLPVIFVSHLYQNPHQTIRRTVPVAAIALLLIGFTVFLGHEVMMEQIRILIEYQKPALSRWNESFTSTFLFQTHPFVTVAAVLSIIVALIKRDTKYPIILFLVLLILVMQLRRIRYILPIFPMIALLASYSLQVITTDRIKRYFTFCAISSSLVLLFMVYIPFLNSLSAVNIKGAGTFINSLTDVKTVEVYAVPESPPVANPLISIQLLDLFCRKNMVYGGMLSKVNLDQFKNTPLRFSWHQKIPRYYKPNPAINAEALVVFSNKSNPDLPLIIARKTIQYSKSKVFEDATGLFSYKTILTVYYQPHTNK